MNRVIKFRAWDEDTKRMGEIKRLELGSPKIAMYSYFHRDGEYDTEEVALSLLVLMQFTGLTDKNGIREMYEDDIVNFFDPERGAHFSGGRIVYDSGAFCVSSYRGRLIPLFKVPQIEVIGNIYQHPHLLSV